QTLCAYRVWPQVEHLPHGIVTGSPRGRLSRVDARGVANLDLRLHARVPARASRVRGLALCAYRVWPRRSRNARQSVTTLSRQEAAAAGSASRLDSWLRPSSRTNDDASAHVGE